MEKSYFAYLIYILCFILTVIFENSFFPFLICVVLCFIFKNKASASENNKILDLIRQCYILINIVQFLFGKSFPFGNYFMANAYMFFLNNIIMHILFILIEIIYHKTIKIKKTTTDDQGNLVCYYIHDEKKISLALCEIMFILFKMVFFIVLSRIISIDSLLTLCDNIPYLGNLIVWLILDILIGGIFAFTLFKILNCIFNFNKELFMRIIIPLVFLPINFYIIPSMFIMIIFMI